jgi:hypothetical protein
MQLGWKINNNRLARVRTTYGERDKYELNSGRKTKEKTQTYVEI